MIDMQSATFTYDNKVVLKDINLKVEEPGIIGLWGRNGAGKTTLMKLISGQENLNEGSIKVKNITPYNNAEVTYDICFMQEDHPVSSIWNVNDALRFGKLFNRNWNQEEANMLKDMFKVPDKKKIAKFSKGMKTATQIIIGLASNADITILDEPTNGLDAGMRKKFYKALQDSFDARPRVILISTHHIEEIQSLCESLIVLHNNRVLLHKPLDDIRSKGTLLAGEREKVEIFLKGCRVFDKVTMGNTMKAMVDLTYTKELKQSAADLGISVEKAQLQDYLLNITSDMEGSYEYI
jgi:ABC-2 type transport system ATP-binding protein